MFDHQRSAENKIEVRDGKERQTLSPQTGVTFLKNLNSDNTWQGDGLDIMIEGNDTGRYSSIQPGTGRPGSHASLAAAKIKPARISQIKLKDSVMTQRVDRMYNLNKTATAGFGHLGPSSGLKLSKIAINPGSITNYKKT